jgi:hypothetical protein
LPRGHRAWTLRRDRNEHVSGLHREIEMDRVGYDDARGLRRPGALEPGRGAAAQRQRSGAVAPVGPVSQVADPDTPEGRLLARTWSGAADDNLEPSDILEMVNAGIVPLTLSDSLAAEFWAKVFTQLHPHSDVVLTETGATGWAIRTSVICTVTMPAASRARRQ